MADILIDIHFCINYIVILWRSFVKLQCTDILSSGDAFALHCSFQYLMSHFAQVASFPFDDHNCPPIQLIISFCKSAYSWLKEDIENVVVVHCKAGMARTGLMISSLLLYLKVTLNSYMKCCLTLLLLSPEIIWVQCLIYLTNQVHYLMLLLLLLHYAVLSYSGGVY